MGLTMTALAREDRASGPIWHGYVVQVSAWVPLAMPPTEALKRRLGVRLIKSTDELT